MASISTTGSKALDSFLKIVNEPSDIIELRAGRGGITRELARRGHAVTVLADGEWYELANPYAKAIVQKSVEEALLPYHSFAGVWAADAFDSCRRTQLGAVLGRVANWLSKGGVLYACFPEGEGDKVLKQQTAQGERETRLIYYRPEELERLLHESGFHILDAWRDGTVEKPFIHVIARV